MSSSEIFMKIIFFGTPDYVVPILDCLNKTFKEKAQPSITAVVTQGPKPTGRKQILVYSPVDAWAHKRSIPVFHRPPDLVSSNLEADLGIVAAYGSKIPDSVTKQFPRGILVIHPSLLPLFRWGSPVQATLITGNNTAGGTIIKMDNEFDHGPILARFKENVLPTDTTESLRARLFEKSAPVLVEMIPSYLAGKMKVKPQDHSKATYARTLKKEDGFIPPEFIEFALRGKGKKKRWTIDFIHDNSHTPLSILPTPEFLERFIRAMKPWPTAWTLLRLSASEGQARRLKILKAHLDISHQSLVLDEVQLEGKNPVSWKQFKEAYPLSSFS